MAPFVRNAIEWLDEGRNGVIGFAPGLGDAFALSKESNKNCTTTHFRDDLSVFVCTAYSDKHKDEIQDFVAEGGGLLIGGHAWSLPLSWYENIHVHAISPPQQWMEGISGIGFFVHV
uniref:Uncharacterized protein n=1 Tax=Echeneis naucrates TaxID=173247 RepID=A0A665V8S8_ECHNA